MLEPWSHEILIELPEPSFLSIIMGADFAENMLVKVYFKATG